jgi:hypothetical protein
MKSGIIEKICTVKLRAGIIKNRESLHYSLFKTEKQFKLTRETIVILQAPSLLKQSEIRPGIDFNT